MDALNLFDKMTKSGFQGDVFMYGALINGLCKIGEMDFIVKLHKRMVTENCSANLVTL